MWRRKNPLHHFTKAAPPTGGRCSPAWPLDHARRCRARCSDRRGRRANPTPKLRFARRELFAALEPQALKVQTIQRCAPGCCNNFRSSQCRRRFSVLDDRPDRDDGAAIWGAAGRCARTESATGARSTSDASAADVTFKDVVREACLSRDHFMPGPMRRPCRPAAAQLSHSAGRRSRHRIEDVGRRSLMPEFGAVGMPAGGRPSNRQQI